MSRLKSYNKNTKNNKDDYEKIVIERSDILYIKSNPKLMFELGAVLRYTKLEYKESILRHYIYAYSYSNRNKKGINILRDLDYFSNLILILEDELTTIQKQGKIQNLMNFVGNNEEELLKLCTAIDKVREYTIPGNKIDDLLSLNLLDDTLLEKEEEISKLLSFRRINQ